ncbi:MAG: 3-hydroxybutyryl-CoA dehydrogenase, partial [Acidobacteriaceae bacterium]|nr:3-hydroxybutyryl-CoA dehydrogenase [Acidobacteriaceae bacterium]
MGAGIAQVAATAGHVVKLYDIRPEAVNKAIEDVRKNLQRFVGKNRLSAEVAEAAASRVQPAARIQELAGVKLAIEAVVEDLAVKKRLFAELEQVVDEDCILATNTSSLSITAIASDLKRPARIAGMHFFNPAPLMELVEVISGLTTDPSSAEL